jgi:hypothetical protein
LSVLITGTSFSKVVKWITSVKKTLAVDGNKVMSSEEMKKKMSLPAYKMPESYLLSSLLVFFHKIMQCSMRKEILSVKGTSISFDHTFKIR